MGLKRRQLLILGGTTALGTAASLVAHGLRQSLQPQAKTFAAPANQAPTAPQSKGRTAPAPAGLYAPRRGDVRLVVFSDLNSRYGSTAYRAEVEEAVQMLPDWEPDLVICGGDMVAGQSLNLTRPEVEAMWHAFDQRILTPIRSANLPYAFTLGNHDASSQRNFEGQYVYGVDRDVTREFWTHPNQQLGIEFVDKGKFPFYYSFEADDIFYLVWDASSAKVPPEQVRWAERSLASDRAQKAKMRIVLGHLPFYAISQGRDRAGEVLNQADQLRSLLERYNVHTYICGHHHAYFPGRVGNLEMLHCGALGSGPRTWLDTTAAAIQTLTVVDIDWASESTRYTTYNMGTREVVQHSELPRLVVGPNGRTLRRDLTLADLTVEERDRQHVLSK